MNLTRRSFLGFGTALASGPRSASRPRSPARLGPPALDRSSPTRRVGSTLPRGLQHTRSCKPRAT